MEAAIIIVFIVGYLAITLEHNLKIDKLIPALVMMAISWALISLGIDAFPEWFDSANHGLVDGFAGLDHDNKMHLMDETLLHHLGKTAEILVFLLGAMTIVEIIDYFDGFSTIKSFIKTKKKTKILWIFAGLAFILSAIIDNLTATIVLISILQKIVKDRSIRLWYAGLIIIAANAGGAWSPIGDVTTTMLWIGNQITAPGVVVHLICPSLVALIVPLVILGIRMKGNVTRPVKSAGLEHYTNPTTTRERNIVFIAGVAGLLFVPIFKTYTHLPPFMGMMFSLGVLWLITELLHLSLIHI